MISLDEIWTTKEGKKIPIGEMSGRHLLNTHRMLREKLIDVKNFQNDAYIFSPSEDTIAYDMLEEALEESYDICIGLSLKITVFEKEIQKRELEPLEPRIKEERMNVISVEHTEFGKIMKIEKDIEFESQKVHDRLKDKGWSFPSEDDIDE